MLGGFLQDLTSFSCSLHSSPHILRRDILNRSLCKIILAGLFPILVGTEIYG